MRTCAPEVEYEGLYESIRKSICILVYVLAAILYVSLESI